MWFDLVRCRLNRYDAVTMERPETPADGSAWTPPTWAWLTGAAALIVWHGWLTLALFGDDPLERLTNTQPITSGTHGQHLYLATVGAKAIVTHGRSTVYDHRYQIGYPKTPIFDGARLGELFLLLGGGTYQPAVYKIGFVITCMMVPIFLMVACRSLGFGVGTTLLATLLGELVWWGQHGRSSVLTGDCGLYLASLAALAHIGLLVAFHKNASVSGWIGLLLTGAIGWFLQPLLFPLALPILLIYYLSVGTRHDFLTWHIAFWCVQIFAVVVNLPWLIEWVDSWWLRTPLPSAVDLLEHRTFETIWEAPIWGGAENRILAVILFGSALVGAGILNHKNERVAARLLSAGCSGSLALALLGVAWEPLGVLGTSILFAPALWFGCVLAARAWVSLGEWLWQMGTYGRVILLSGLVSAAASLGIWTDLPANILDRTQQCDTLEIGLGPDRKAIVDALIQHTTDDARILWEDRTRNRQASRWSALLPVFTDRCYIGGLDPDGFMEHSSISLMNQALDSQPIATWTNEYLAEYCWRYNVRWVVAWSPVVIQRFENWPATKKIQALKDGETGWLFAIDRTSGFALKGSADFLGCDGRNIVLGNVVPENGEVVLSLHYQAGMRASLPRVQVERAELSQDRIGFIRLRLAERAAGVTVTWER